MTEYTKISDKDLIALIKMDDKIAFAEFYDRYKGGLYLHALKMLDDSEDARDVVQEMLAKVWENRRSITINSTVEAYMHMCVRNKIIDFIRRKKTMARYLESMESFLKMGTAALDEVYIEKETLALFKREESLLPPRMREVFDLSRNQGLSHKQIAERLNIAENTVKKQLNKAIRRMRMRINLRIFCMLFL